MEILENIKWSIKSWFKKAMCDHEYRRDNDIGYIKSCHKCHDYVNTSRQGW